MKLIKSILSSILLLIMTLKSTVFAINPSKDLFENAKSIHSLLAAYREDSNNASLSDDELLDIARQDWHEIAMKELENGMSFDSLPAEVVTVDGVEYRLYGYTHGFDDIPLFTMSKQYRNFIHEAYKLEDSRIRTCYSNALDETYSRSTFITAEQYLLRKKIKDNYIIDVKDHRYIKKTPDFLIGLLSGAYVPLLIIAHYYNTYLTDTIDSLGMSYFKESSFSMTKDSINIEIEQGLKKALPSHLEMEAFLAKIKNEAEIDNGFDPESNAAAVTRSLYMAGFLKGFAEKGQFIELPFFMGRGHLAEVKGFLIDTNGHAQKTSAYNTGKEMGSLIAETLIDAQKNGDAEELQNAITQWNPILINTTTLYQKFTEEASNDYYLGLALGLPLCGFILTIGSKLVIRYYFLYPEVS